MYSEGVYVSKGARVNRKFGLDTHLASFRHLRAVKYFTEIPPNDYEIIQERQDI